MNERRQQAITRQNSIRFSNFSFLSQAKPQALVSLLLSHTHASFQ